MQKKIIIRAWTASLVAAVIISSLLFAVLSFYDTGQSDSRLVGIVSDAVRRAQTAVDLENDMAAMVKRQQKGIARSLVKTLAAEPDIAGNYDRLATLAGELELSEVYITDKDGIVTAATYPGIVGYNLRESADSRRFIEILDNKKLVVSTEQIQLAPGLALMRYTGVAREDAEGLVIIGSVSALQDSLSRAAQADGIAAYLSGGFGFGSGIYLFAADASGNEVLYIDGHSAQADGVSGLLSAAAEPDMTKTYQAAINGTTVRYRIGHAGNITIGAGFTLSGIYAYVLPVTLGAFAAVLVCCGVVIWLITGFLKRGVVTDIDKITDGMAKIAEGDTDITIDIHDFPEYAGLRVSIDKMLASVTEKVKSSQEIVRKLGISEREAQSANEAKTVFLANMSHELRTPLNAVIGFTELALDDVLTERTEDYLRKIQLSTDGLLNIINNILDITKIEAGKVMLENIPLSIPAMLKMCKTINMAKAKEKGLTFTVFAAPEASLTVLGDPTKLRQAILNLISNAIKFTRSGLVKAAVSLDRVQPADNERVRLLFEVADSGIGMTPGQISEIFKPFTQADVSTTRKYGGTGLGLSITRNLVGLMGGNLEVESSPGVGTRFSFTLEFELAKVEAEPQENPLLPENKKPRFMGEVLVFEDSLLNQQVITEHLLRIGLSAVSAENGKAGVELAASRLDRPFDLIFMDIHMPVMDGVEATKRLRDMDIRTPIIAMTANVTAQSRAQYLSSGMNAYIGKPFLARELWGVIMKFLKPFEFTETAIAMPHKADKGAVIDYAEGLEHSAGDLRLYNKVQSDFMRNAPSLMEDMKTASASGDIKRAHRIAHTIKGQAGLIGAKHLWQVSYDVENAFLRCIKEDRISAEAMSQMSRMDNQLGIVIKEMSDVADAAYSQQAAHYEKKSQRDASAPRISEGSVFEIIRQLEPMIRDGYADAVETAEKLRFAPENSPVEQIRVERLISLLEEFEFDSALLELHELRGSVNDIGGDNK